VEIKGSAIALYRVASKSVALRQNQTWPKPDLSPTQQYDLGHVSEPLFLRLGEGGGTTSQSVRGRSVWHIASAQ
jgi:hypothetical protein